MLVAKGGANILLELDHRGVLYRCNVRDKSLKVNNEYTYKNYRYINQVVRPLLGDCIPEMELVDIPYDRISSIIGDFVGDPDSDHVSALTIKNLRPTNVYGEKIRYDDHFTKVYHDDTMEHILVEIKPKWLHHAKFCRNCTHNNLKNRKIPYCYALMVVDPSHVSDMLLHTGIAFPKKFLIKFVDYFSKSDNILAKLHDIQKNLDSNVSMNDIKSIADVSDAFLLNMTLKDVSCFIEWTRERDSLEVNVVDVDMKLVSKLDHWVNTHKQLSTSSNLVHH